MSKRTPLDLQPEELNTLATEAFKEAATPAPRPPRSGRCLCGKPSHSAASPLCEDCLFDELENVHRSPRSPPPALSKDTQP